MRLVPDPAAPTVAMAFKIVEDPFGTLTFMRIYQGKFVKGETLLQPADRAARSVSAGSCGCTPTSARTSTWPWPATSWPCSGVDCASGDTYASEYPYCTLENMFVPEPVIKMAIEPATRDGADRLSKALHRFRREDPTLHVATDEETGETIIAGMGELHLEIYVERIRREYGVEVEVGPPKVNYREAPTQTVEFNIRHKKQTGGSGQFAHIVGRMGPLTGAGRRASDVRLRGARRRRSDPQAVHPGRREGLPPDVGQGARGRLPGGRSARHASRTARTTKWTARTWRSRPPPGRRCARRSPERKPILLEPVMKIEIECPAPFQGSVVGDLTSRRGMILATSMDAAVARIEGEIPLAETFGYSTDLRSMTQGQGTFTMEFARYKPLPPSLQRDVIAERKKASLAGVG